MENVLSTLLKFLKKMTSLDFFMVDKRWTGDVLFISTKILVYFGFIKLLI